MTQPVEAPSQAQQQGFSRDDADVLVGQTLRRMGELDPGTDEWIEAAQILQVAVGQLVPVGARRWKSMRRQMLRMVQGFRYVEKEVERILEGCEHAEGCPALADRTRPCLQTCRDREVFLSALVIHENAKLHTLLQSSLPKRLDADYRPPGREIFDAVCAELEILREARDIIAEIESYVRANPGASPNDVVTEPAPPPERPLSRLLEASEETGAGDPDETNEDLEALADEDLDEDQGDEELEHGST